MNAMQPPQSVEEVKATLETTEKGGVRQSIRNCLTVFQRDPVLAGAIAYNILTDRKDIIKPIGFHRESTALTDTDMKYLLLYLEETYGLTSEKKIETAIGIVANENKYHPICGGRNGVSSPHFPPLFLFVCILVFCLPVPDNMSRIRSVAKE